MLINGTAWQVAAARGILAAVLSGGLAFLAVFSQTDDVKTLLIAGLTPALTTLGVRFLGEGWLDSRAGGP